MATISTSLSALLLVTSGLVTLTSSQSLGDNHPWNTWMYGRRLQARAAEEEEGGLVETAAEEEQLLPFRGEEQQRIVERSAEDVVTDVIPEEVNRVHKYKKRVRNARLLIQGADDKTVTLTGIFHRPAKNAVYMRALCGEWEICAPPSAENNNVETCVFLSSKNPLMDRGVKSDLPTEISRATLRKAYNC